MSASVEIASINDIPKYMPTDRRKMDFNAEKCMLCPRKCGANRKNSTGVCGVGDKINISRASLHFWEEPPISGKNGSGAIFFSGCSLGCIYCQNHEISSGSSRGADISIERLREICFELKALGAHNINLVTPTHYAPMIYDAIAPIKKELALPIVCNTGGYESDETLEYFRDIIDIYLPDFKYALPESAKRLSHAGDYPEIALKALKKMLSFAGKPSFDSHGIMKKGIIVRHLVIPGERKNSLEVIKLLHDNFSKSDFLLSLMNQYTPIEGMKGALSRRLTTFEYESVLSLAEEYVFDGFSQESSSSSPSFTPAFDLSGVIKSDEN